MNKKIIIKHASTQDESGQSIVLVALAMVGIIAVLGLVFDATNVFAQRRKMQNAADAASIAGAQVLALASDNSYATEQKILTAINTYAANNGAPTTVTGYFVDSSGNQTGIFIGGNGNVPPSASGVRASTQIAFPTFFLGVISQASGIAGATATAQTGAAGAPTTGLMPIGVPRCYVDPNSPGPDFTDPDTPQNATKASLCGSGDQSIVSHVILGQGAQDPSGSSSYRGIINLPVRFSDERGNSSTSGCSANSYNKQDAVRYINAGGYNDSEACGNPDYQQYIDVLTGNSNGNAGVDGYRDASWNGQPMFPVGTVIVICVYPEGSVGNGTKETVKCVGFAAMKITGYSSNNLSAVFAGKFVQSGAIVPGATDTWSKRKAVQLIE